MADPEFYADDDAGGGGGGEDPELLAELRDMMKASAQGSVETQRGSDDEDRELLAEYEALAASVEKASGSIEPPPSYEAVTVKPPSAQAPDSVAGNSSEKVAQNSGIVARTTHVAVVMQTLPAAQRRLLRLRLPQPSRQHQTPHLLLPLKKRFRPQLSQPQ